MIPEELRWIYTLILKYHNKVRVGKVHRDKAVSLILSSIHNHDYLEVIIGGSKGRRWRIKTLKE